MLGVILVAAVLAVVLLVIWDAVLGTGSRESRARIRALRQRVEDLESRVERLEEKIGELGGIRRSLSHAPRSWRRECHVWMAQARSDSDSL